MAGLASAFWLSELLPHARIILLEASDRLGGLIATRREDGYLLECGPLAFPSGAPATGTLLRRAGLAPLCVPSRSEGGIGIWDGRRVAAAPKSAWDVLRQGLLSPRALLRLLCEPFIRRKDKHADTSIREFFRRRTGEEFFECLLEPMAAGILAGDPDRLSLGSNLPRYQAMERDSGSLARAWFRDRLRGAPRGEGAVVDLPPAATAPGGCAMLVEGLAEELRYRGVRLETSCEVRSLARLSPGFALRWQSRGREEVGEFEEVIAALPARRLADLDADWPAGVGEFLKGIPHVPISPVFLAYPSAEGATGFAGEAILPQPKAGEEVLSCFLPSRMVPGRCPPGQVLLRFLLGGARKAHLASLTPPQAELLAARAARRILGFSGEPSFARTLRHEPCLPQLEVGHGEALARCRESLRREWPGFHLAGTSFQGPGIENAAMSGRLAATEAARRLHPVAEGAVR